MREISPSYRTVTKDQVDPKSGVLEVCAKCKARPGKPCVNEKGKKVRIIHLPRMDARAERERIIYDKDNYKKIKARRISNAIRREKRAKNPTGNPHKERFKHESAR